MSGKMLPEACSPGAIDAVGDVIDGRYLLMKRAGAGAAGTVWVARDLVRGIDVAVKLLRGTHLDKEAILAHFAREAELAGRMHSPHIVRVLARGSTRSHGPYVVYEHLDGQDLGTLLAERGRLPIVETRNVVVQACRALARAHALGVLHRDIKPSNLFLATGADERLVLKVLDFGLAEVMGRDEHDPHTLAGTLEYIPPEILFGESAPDVKSDLFALAVVAYECLTGRVPYRAQSVEDLIFAYASQPPPSPSALRRGLPPEIDAWFERALHRDPAARFQTARELAEGLDRALESIDRAPASSAGWVPVAVASTSRTPSGASDDLLPAPAPRFRSTIRPRGVRPMIAKREKSGAR